MLSKTQEAYINDYYYAALEELSQGTQRHQLVTILVELEESKYIHLLFASIKSMQASFALVVADIWYV